MGIRGELFIFAPVRWHLMLKVGVVDVSRLIVVFDVGWAVFGCHVPRRSAR